MKWKSVDEKPKIDGLYFCSSLDLQTNKKRMGYSCFDEIWDAPNNRYKVIAWLDPEIPEEFLKPKEEEKKPCPWCGNTNWGINDGDCSSFYYFDCQNLGCRISGPVRPTAAEAEAAIFERVK